MCILLYNYTVHQVGSSSNINNNNNCKNTSNGNSNTSSNNSNINNTNKTQLVAAAVWRLLLAAEMLLSC